VEPLTLDTLPTGALVLMDTAPIVYFLEAQPKLAKLFRPLFERHAAGELQFAVTTVSIAEVLTGPLQSGNEALAERFRTILGSWQVVDLTADIAASAARLRASLRLKLACRTGSKCDRRERRRPDYVRSGFFARAIPSRIALNILRLVQLFGRPALAGRRRPRGATPVRLPDPARGRTAIRCYAPVANLRSSATRLLAPTRVVADLGDTRES
jgi:predicted nucleic acid-binding protein